MADNININSESSESSDNDSSLSEDDDSIPDVVPTTFLQCFNANGDIHDNNYLQYIMESSRRQLVHTDARTKANADTNANPTACIITTEVIASKRKRSCLKRNNNLRRTENEDGFIEMTCRDTSWYVSYIEFPALHDNLFHLNFRNRFRCSYNSFIKLLGLLETHDKFERWQSTDATGKSASPLPLLLLGALRYVGRGWVFDDLQENTSINRETHRQFIHVFIAWGATYLHDKFISIPTNMAEAKQHEKEMEIAGFPGCIASTDATHVCMLCCPSTRTNEHSGHKLPLPARTYNISLNHIRQILHTTKGHPSRWNDKTLAYFDTCIHIVKEGRLPMEFSLFETDPHEVSKVIKKIIQVVILFVIMDIMIGPA